MTVQELDAIKADNESLRQQIEQLKALSKVMLGDGKQNEFVGSPIDQMMKELWAGRMIKGAQMKMMMKADRMRTTKFDQMMTAMVDQMRMPLCRKVAQTTTSTCGGKVVDGWAL